MKHVLIMGAGLIGCEFANDLVASGYAETVVDPSNGPIAALLPLDASRAIARRFGGFGRDLALWRDGESRQQSGP